jgi:hypothetical protein
MSQHLVNIVKSRMGVSAITNIHARFDDHDGSRVMVVKCGKAPTPVFVKDDDRERFYIRTGPATTELTASHRAAGRTRMGAVSLAGGIAGIWCKQLAAMLALSPSRSPNHWLQTSSDQWCYYDKEKKKTDGRKEHFQTAKLTTISNCRWHVLHQRNLVYTEVTRGRRSHLFDPCPL